MILELASQSIQTKLRLGSGTMLGNYEFYYAAGILCGKLNLDLPEDSKPQELYDGIRTETDGKEFEDPVVSHLAKMIHYYMPEERWDGQMRELFCQGREGK